MQTASQQFVIPGVHLPRLQRRMTARSKAIRGGGGLKFGIVRRFAGPRKILHGQTGALVDVTDAMFEVRLEVRVPTVGDWRIVGFADHGDRWQLLPGCNTAPPDRCTAAVHDGTMHRRHYLFELGWQQFAFGGECVNDEMSYDCGSELRAARSMARARRDCEEAEKWGYDVEGASTVETIAAALDHDYERASKIVSYLVDYEGDSTFWLSTRRMMQVQGVDAQHAKMIVEAYQRVTKPASKTPRAGEHVEFDGEVLSAKLLTSRLAITTMVKFRDDAGSVYVWFARGLSSLAPGTRCRVRGLVKKYEIYLNQRQIVISHCRIDGETHEEGS